MSKREGLPPSHQVAHRLDGWIVPEGGDPTRVPVEVGGMILCQFPDHLSEVDQIKMRMIDRHCRVLGDV